MVNFFAPINQLGIGVHAYNLIREYSKYDKVSLIPPFGNVTAIDEEVEKWLSNDFDKDSPSIMIFQPQFMTQFCGSPRIGYPIFETTEFTRKEMNALKSLDYILVTSRWAEEILNDKGLKNIAIVHEGYNPLVYYPDYSKAYKLDRIEKNGVTFVTVGKLEERKGTFDIFLCFNKAFSGCDKKVNLIAHVANAFNVKWFFKVAAFLYSLGFEKEDGGAGFTYFKKDKMKIIIPLGNIQSGKDMADFYRRADFGIYLSKAEGWGLPLMETLACGVPCVTTNWTGQSEYLKRYPASLIVEKGSEETANDGVWFKGDKGRWRKPDLESAIKILKNIYNDPTKWLDMEIDCLECVKPFIWENSAIQLKTVLREVGYE